MKVDRRTLDSHRAALLASATRLFRGRGVDAVTIADVSRSAGLTHGAFYGHYASKEVLAAAACRSALTDAAIRWRARAARAREQGADPVGAIIDAYLTEPHRDAPEDGCALATLGQEFARATPTLRMALADGTEALLGVLTEEIQAARPGEAGAACQDAAVAVLSVLVGGLMVARAIADQPDRSRVALASAAALARAAAAG